MTTIEHRSLRVNVLDLIGKFLFDEGFSRNLHLPEGILNLIDLTSAYHEEGEELFPEIFITNSIDSVLETLPFSKIIEIADAETTVSEFNQVLKLCAPLSKDGWVIYINVNDSRMSYGLVSTEISELSPGFRSQAVGELSENKDQYSIAYLQNVGNKSVLLKGSETQALISLSLSSNSTSFGEELSAICRSISSDIDQNYRKTAESYFEKIIGEAAIVGHGNLVGVIKDDNGSLLALKTRHPDGIYLKTPIDLSELLISSEESNSREASTVNRLYSSIVQSMLNHDGLTVFTSSGKLIGYHIFVKSSENENVEVVGGARSRAFEVMKASSAFCCCFYKSQDGNERIWSFDNV
jgi:hypothetical protein